METLQVANTRDAFRSAIMQSDDDEQRVGTQKVCARYDNVCPRTIDRWIVDAKLNFPKPMMINGRRFWTLGELRRWERRRAARVS